MYRLEIGVISVLFGAMRHVMDRKLGLYLRSHETCNGQEIGVISVLFGAMKHVQTGNWGYISAFWSDETFLEP